MPGAHPRSRGENDEKWAASDAIQGSSPLTRGKPAIPGFLSLAIRLIPAHAGKTRPWLRVCGVPEAHPRSRGENNIEETTGALSAGSSPLTRGKRARELVLSRGVRLIPAHAGKTVA